ncbi:MAG TPA: 5-(carboxyamino)imidazole ribonucleotide mutase [Desulfatiglandales bacterium]|nr:5-(carboxyamino)imidazole ribonucleotide mutase [Desulfatiglandales bacterium]
MQNKPLVGVVMGSASDKNVMEECVKTLKEFNIDFELIISSAHRSPDKTRDYAINARDRGVEVIIAGAGWAAHLAGVLASYTTLPVIGVPIDSSPLKGMDSLLAIVQMPPGVPVATMAIGGGGAKNAAVFAAQILALKYDDISNRLKEYKEKIKLKTQEANKD